MIKIKVINKKNVLVGLLFLIGIMYIFSSTLIYSNKISLYIDKQIIRNKVDNLLLEINLLKSHINKTLPIVDAMCNKSKVNIKEDKDIKLLGKILAGFELGNPKTILSKGFLLIDRYNTDVVAALSITDKQDIGQTIQKEGGDLANKLPEDPIDRDIKELEKLEDYNETGIDSQTEAKQHNSPENIRIKNSTKKTFDISTLLTEKIDIDIPDKGAVILIVHTHTCESYTPTLKNNYSPSDPNRTENEEYNIVRVGKEMKKDFEAMGVSVIHDTTMHDYPSYSGCYKRSLNTIEQEVKKNPSIRFVLDIHRDALVLNDGQKLRLHTKINEETVAQPMLVVGTGESGLLHERWLENFKVALRIQNKFNILYPGFARDIDLTQHRYNQHVTMGSLIIEVGANGNTLEEAINSSKYITKAITEVINDLKK